MKILKPTFGILVILTKNELTKICNEPGMNSFDYFDIESFSLILEKRGLH